MSCPQFRAELEHYDLNLFTETHMRPNQHDTVDLPEGYKIISRTRRPKASFDKSWGGVATVISQSIPHSTRDDLSGPDFMVVQIGNRLIYNVYILPESTNWAGHLESDPCKAVENSLALAYMGRFEIVLMGDLNARTGSIKGRPHDPDRVSKDETISPRGRWLARLCADYDLVIVSGATRMGPDSGNFTSFQGTRKTVIDYMLCSRPLFDKISSFEVCEKVDKFDHAARLATEIEMEINLNENLNLRRTKKRKVEVVLPKDTDLDRLFIATLDAGKDEKKKSLSLFGPVKVVTDRMKVMVHGICTNTGKISAAAGVGSYWGPNSTRNRSVRVWGTQDNVVDVENGENRKSETSFGGISQNDDRRSQPLCHVNSAAT
ncbi:hypothetical protein C8R47DRAFT_1074816 [Mycena vitilis]|nr:hypothetical protein C8R47DRAFT_1074816 [Mycena vitilis]